jgi:hypothetical protein
VSGETEIGDSAARRRRDRNGIVAGCLSITRSTKRSPSCGKW